MSDDFYSSANSALGLFNNIDRLREQTAFKERGDAIAKALADNGGDFHALDPKLYSDRAGMAALASHVNAWSQTEQGKQTILENQIKDAQYQTRLLGQYGSEIDKAMQSGNSELATSLACSFSKAIRSPHSVSKSKEPGMLDIIFASPDGEQKTGTMSLNDFLSMMKGYQQNSPEWNKYLVLNGLALNEINNEKRENFDQDYVSVGKDGKEISLIPQVDYNEKGEIERLFFLPGTGNLSEAQLSQMGFSKPMKATDARKEKMDNRRLDMEDRRIGLYAASIAARGGQRNLDGLPYGLTDGTLNWIGRQATTKDEMQNEIYNPYIGGSLEILIGRNGLTRNAALMAFNAQVERAITVAREQNPNLDSAQIRPLAERYVYESLSGNGRVATPAPAPVITSPIQASTPNPAIQKALEQPTTSSTVPSSTPSGIGLSMVPDTADIQQVGGKYYIVNQDKEPIEIDRATADEYRRKQKSSVERWIENARNGTTKLSTKHDALFAQMTEEEKAHWRKTGKFPERLNPRH